VTGDSEPNLDSLSLPRRGRTALRWFAGVAAALALATLSLGAARVVRLQRAEFALQTPATTLRSWRDKPNATRISARLAEVTLHAHQFSLFELCSGDGLPEARWLGALEFVVLHLEAKQVMVRVPLDAAHLAHVRRNAAGGCLLLGSGPIEHSGTYTVEAVWPDQQPSAAVLDVPIELHVSAKLPLDARDRRGVLLLGFATLGLLGSALLAARGGTRTTASVEGSAEPTDATPTPRSMAARAALALLAIGSVLAASELPIVGSSAVLAKGLGLFGLQVGLAYGLARPLADGRTAQLLGLVAPRHVASALGSALLAWPLLVASARLALRWVPQTGEAPIETFISWPSGMLAAALLGVLLPAAEELFFRGYLYAALLPLGRAAAAIVSVCVFGLLHAEQSWGNWGGLAAVFAVGAVLCATRVVSGSTLIAALVHVAYNLTLSVASIAASERGA
jgi:membrane protease YdiL (CAAX protease family)